MGMTMDFATRYDPDRPAFCLKTAEADLDQEEDIPLAEFEKEESCFCLSASEELIDRINTKALRRHDKTMDVHLNTHLNELSAYVTKQLHPQESRRKLWEVYCGASRTSQVAETLGMEVRRFSYGTGWDFKNLAQQEASCSVRKPHMASKTGTCWHDQAANR